MIPRYARVVAATILVLCFSIPGFAQNKKKYKSASLDGPTGLFKTWDAEALRQGEFNLSFGFDYFNRDPGRLIIRRFPVSVAVGVSDRFELFASYDVQKHIDASGVLPYGTLPGELPQPASNLAGVPSFNNIAPFIDVPKAGAPGNLFFGGIVTALSERMGDPLGFGFTGFLKLPTSTDITYLNRGLTSGAANGGLGLLFSKTAGRTGKFYLNTDVNFYSSPTKNDVELADLQNEFIYRGGAAFPTYGPFQIIAEVDGKVYFGERTAGLNPRSPVNLIFGFKVYPREWISFGGGYQASLNHIEENRALDVLEAGTNGLVAQLAFGRRVHEPPKVTCLVSPQEIEQDQTATARANVVVTNGEEVTYAWSASGGKITGHGDTATFDATGIAPGKYTITVTVSDDYGHHVPCSTEITVKIKPVAPTVRCEPSSTTITVGESATIRAVASDVNNLPLTYSWTINGQPVAATGPTITFGSEGRQPGTYTVAVTVSNTMLTSSCSSTITVREKPNLPPTIECLTPTVDVESGKTAELRVRATDPERQPLTITWSTTGGTVTGTGETATFNATDLKAGSYTVTSTATDPRGAKASCTTTVNVSQSINVPGFGYGSTRLNNVMKAQLDDVAVELQNNPRLHATIVGYTDNSRRETRAKDLGERRARAAADYLESKGIDASRLTVTNGGVSTIGDNKTAAGRKENRRVEIRLSVR